MVGFVRIGRLLLPINAKTCKLFHVALLVACQTALIPFQKICDNAFRKTGIENAPKVAYQ